MGNLILAAQILVGVGLTATILLQSKGSGVSAVFGGEGMSFRSRRGVEKLLHRGTVVLGILFMGLAVVNLLISR